MSGPSTLPRARAITVDVTSQLVDAPAESTLGAVEDALAGEGLTLALGGALPRDETVASFVEAGAPGAPSPFSDPADHLLAGLVAVGLRGDRLVVKPAPRRSVGPDLVALVHGQGGRFFRLESVWLRAWPIPGVRPSIEHAVRPDPPLGDDERRLLDRVDEALRAR